MAVSNWVDEYIQEKNLFTRLRQIFDERGWVIFNPNDIRISFDKKLTKPEIVIINLRGNMTQNAKVVLPDTLAKKDYVIYSPDTNNVQYTETQGTTGLTIEFNPADNGLTIEDDTMKIYVFYSGIAYTDVLEFHAVKSFTMIGQDGISYGVSLHAQFKTKAGNLPYAIPFAIYDTSTYAQRLRWGTRLTTYSEQLFDWVKTEAEKYYRLDTLYFHFIEYSERWAPIYPAPEYYYFQDIIGWESADDNDLKRAALDQEVITAFWELTDNDTLEYLITFSRPASMQSQAIALRHRLPQLMTTKTIYNIEVPIQNHWPDSLIHVRGFVDYATGVLTFRCDTATSWEKNAAPLVPLYIGSVDRMPDDQTGEAGDLHAIFCGSAIAVDDGTIEDAQAKASSEDFEDISQEFEYLYPLLKEYQQHPADGNKNIMLRQTRRGARYQAHYISWEAPPNSIPPIRVGGSGFSATQYPRSWQQHSDESYAYQFNPSVYNGKVNASEAYVSHPEDGHVGILRNMILMDPLSLTDGDVLEYIEPCVRVIDYAYFMIEGSSPITHFPSTAFRPAGLGIRKTNLS